MTEWGMLYAITAILWAGYAAEMTLRQGGSARQVACAWILNLLFCPVAIAVASWRLLREEAQ